MAGLTARLLGKDSEHRTDGKAEGGEGKSSAGSGLCLNTGVVTARCSLHLDTTSRVRAP